MSCFFICNQFTYLYTMSLNVTVGADVSAYNTAINSMAPTAKKAANDVSKALSDAAMQTEKLGGAALSSSMKMMQMRSGISAARDGVLAFTVGGQAAERSLLAMGHHFNSLVNETGSFKGALGALGSSLWGPGGVILGLSVAVELFLKWKENQKKAIETQSEWDKALQDNVKTSSDELAHLMILYGATQNDALSRQQRLLAVRELQKEYPAYFGNLSKEAILAGQAAGAYDKLTQSIINSAVVKAGQESLANELKPLIDLQAKLQAIYLENDKIDARQKQNYDRQKRAPVDTTNIDPNTGLRTPNLVRGHRVAIVSQNIYDATKGESESLDKYREEIQDKIKANASAIQRLLEQYGVGTLLKNQGLKDEKIKPEKTLIETLEAELKALQDQEAKWIQQGNTMDWFNLTERERNILRLVADIEKLKQAEKVEPESITNLLKQANVRTGLDGKSEIYGLNTDKPTIGDTSIVKQMQATIKATKANDDFIISSRALERQMTKNEKIGTEITRVFGTGLESAFERALSGTQSFISALSGFIVQLIEKLVAAAAAAAILAVLLKATGFGVALGGAASFSSIFGGLSGLSNIAQHAEGGIFTQPHVGMFGEAGPEAIVTPKHLQDFAGVSGGGGDFKVEHRITGSDLTLWITRANKQKARIS